MVELLRWQEPSFARLRETVAAVSSPQTRAARFELIARDLCEIRRAVLPYLQRAASKLAVECFVVHSQPGGNHGTLAQEGTGLCRDRRVVGAEWV